MAETSGNTPPKSEDLFVSAVRTFCVSVDNLQGIVVATRKGEEGRCSYLHYSLSDRGADWLSRVLEP
jgi:hypothetical protein